MDLGSTLKLNHDLEIQRIRQAKAVLDLDNKLEMAQKSSTRTVLRDNRGTKNTSYNYGGIQSNSS